MKRKASAKIDFIDISELEKIERARIIITKILAAPTIFITPDVNMETFSRKVDTFSELVTLVNEGDHSKKEARDIAEKDVNDDMRVLAKYVSRIADGNEAIIVAGGFNVTKTEIPKPQPPAQAVVSGTPGKVIGSLVLTAEKLEFASLYTFIVSIDLSGVQVVNGTVVISSLTHPVAIKTSKTLKVVFNELSTRVNYQCVCFATSSAGAGKESEIVIVKTL